MSRARSHRYVAVVGVGASGECGRTDGVESSGGDVSREYPPGVVVVEDKVVSLESAGVGEAGEAFPFLAGVVGNRAVGILEDGEGVAAGFHVPFHHREHSGFRVLDRVPHRADGEDEGVVPAGDGASVVGVHVGMVAQQGVLGGGEVVVVEVHLLNQPVPRGCSGSRGRQQRRVLRRGVGVEVSAGEDVGSRAA